MVIVCLIVTRTRIIIEEMVVHDYSNSYYGQSYLLCCSTYILEKCLFIYLFIYFTTDKFIYLFIYFTTDTHQATTSIEESNRNTTPRLPTTVLGPKQYSAQANNNYTYQVALVFSQSVVCMQCTTTTYQGKKGKKNPEENTADSCTNSMCQDRGVVESLCLVPFPCCCSGKGPNTNPMVEMQKGTVHYIR